jgi:hypothetical protein
MVPVTFLSPPPPFPSLSSSVLSYPVPGCWAVIIKISSRLSTSKFCPEVRPGPPWWQMELWVGFSPTGPTRYLWLSCLSFHLGLNICYITFTIVLVQSLPVVVMHKGQHAGRSGQLNCTPWLSRNSPANGLSCDKFLALGAVTKGNNIYPAFVNYNVTHST